jgi:predicted dehydrogenase
VWGSRIEIMRVAGPRGTLDLDGEVVRYADAEGTRELDLVGPPLPVHPAPSDDPRHRFTHIELGPATVQAGVLRDLARGAMPDDDIVPPATFADGLACMQVLDAVRRSAAERGATTSVSRV